MMPFERRQKRRIPKKAIIIAIVVFMLALTGFAVAKKRDITIRNPAGAAKIQTPVSSKGQLTGTDCPPAGETGEKPIGRPMAVMLASDPEARPLGGIGSADMVIEMPVTEGGVTRMMAVFQCALPSEFGSIRSARMDFIPLVKGFDALYMHWGGEHDALAKLNARATDNVDCLKYDGSACRRKANRPMPHNGYSTPNLFLDKAKALGHDIARHAVSYLFDAKAKSQGTIAPPTLYAGGFRVTWTYDPATNSYARVRGGTAEIDRLTNTQVKASNIIFLNTTSEYVNILYNRVKTTGTGTATIYQNGIELSGTWEKSGDTGKLTIKGADGKEIKLTPGSTWFEIVTP
ncbi:MAG: DUF3048 domain-containing protein [Patescibacteria group bacterium]